MGSKELWSRHRFVSIMIEVRLYDLGSSFGAVVWNSVNAILIMLLRNGIITVFFLSLHMVFLLLYMNVLNFYNSRDIPSIAGPPGVPLLFVEGICLATYSIFDKFITISFLSLILFAA